MLGGWDAQKTEQCFDSAHRESTNGWLIYSLFRLRLDRSKDFSMLKITHITFNKPDLINCFLLNRIASVYCMMQTTKPPNSLKCHHGLWLQ